MDTKAVTGPKLVKQYQRITGYIYKSQVLGTVPLYEYYSAK